MQISSRSPIVFKYLNPSAYDFTLKSPFDTKYSKQFSKMTEDGINGKVILLTGNFKTFMRHFMWRNYHYIDLKHVKSTSFFAQLDNLESFFDFLNYTNAQVCVTLDNLEAIFPIDEENRSETEFNEMSIGVKTFRRLIDKLAKNVTVILSCNSIKSLSCSLMRIIFHANHLHFTNAEENLTPLVDCNRLNDQLIKLRLDDSISKIKSMDLCVKSAKKTARFTWSELTGVDDIKEKIDESLLWPIQYPLLYQSNGLDQSYGIVFYGPSGCGKTTIVDSITTALKCHVVRVRGPQLLSKYIGSSEKAVRSLKVPR